VTGSQDISLTVTFCSCGVSMVAMVLSRYQRLA
jgi:hypothetical protein